MTSSVARGVAGAAAPSASMGVRPVDLLDLATDWLSAEAASVRESGRLDLVRYATERASTYEDTLAAATPEEVQLAWEEAVVRQARQEVGSAAWAAAHRVSELLRFECVAVREAPRA